MNARMQSLYSFKLNNEGAINQFKKTGDGNAFSADSFYNASKMIIDELAMANPRFKLAPAAMLAGQHVIKGAFDLALSEHGKNMRGPDHDNETHYEYVTALKPYVVKHLTLHAHRLTDPAVSALKHLKLISEG